MPDFVDVDDLGKRLKHAGRVKLALAVKQTVASITITIGTRMAKPDKIEHREVYGELQLHETLRKMLIAIPDEAIGMRKIWRELGDLVRNADEPLHLKDFCKYIGTPDLSHAGYHVRRAEKAGVIRKVGHQGGWVASS